METKDLMLGDWVNYIGAYKDDSGEIVKLWESPVPIKVTFIIPDAVQYEDEEGCYECLDYELHPIPLTPEILEKNGFEKEIVSGDTYFTLDDIVLQNDYEFGFDFGRFYRDSEDGFVLVSIITIKFVHQLQHALRLCGIEKEIEL